MALGNILACETETINDRNGRIATNAPNPRMSAVGYKLKDGLHKMTSAVPSGTDVPVAMSAISAFPSGVDP